MKNTQLFKKFPIAVNWQKHFNITHILIKYPCIKIIMPQKDTEREREEVGRRNKEEEKKGGRRKERMRKKKKERRMRRKRKERWKEEKI